ncbi:angiopoietin-related protein 7 [Bombina bombina]|uniref:angiopoietin-related protein 7 n=1 Tax=Bombina bombina TaxID=8345 RepID=UPI00235A6167|nr:angiopoietin-related protein 7 [Bombina bombina]
MNKMNMRHLVWTGIFIFCLGTIPALSQKAPKRKPLSANGLTKVPGCCEDVKDLKVQIANLTSLLEELSKKQESDWVNVVMQVMKLEGGYKQIETRMTDVEGKYSEMNNQMDIMQLQAAQTLTQTSADAVYDCSSLFQKNYKISGVYKLPADDFLGSSELEVYCDMETQGGGWTLIQRRKVGLTSFNREWKQYRDGFGNIRGDFWLGNEHIYRLTRRPTVLRVELEDWEGNVRYAEYAQFSVSNEHNSYRLFLGNFSGNAGRDSLRYHNNTAFSTKDKDNDKCLDDCAGLRKGGYWYNCCTDSNLNGVFYRNGDHIKHSDGISWYGWHGSSYSLKRVEMKIRAQDFQP